MRPRNKEWGVPKKSTHTSYDVGLVDRETRTEIVGVERSKSLLTDGEKSLRRFNRINYSVQSMSMTLQIILPTLTRGLPEEIFPLISVCGSAVLLVPSALLDIIIQQRIKERLSK